RGGGEMDEAVARIDGSAPEHAGTLRLVPKYIFADLVNRRRHGAPDSAARFDVSELNPARQSARAVNSDCTADLKRSSASNYPLRQEPEIACLNFDLKSCRTLKGCNCHSRTKFPSDIRFRPLCPSAAAAAWCSRPRRARWWGRRSSGARQIRSAALHRPPHVEGTPQTRGEPLSARL